MQYVNRKNAKTAVTFVASRSAAFAVTTLIRQAVVVEKKNQKVQLVVGVVIIGMMVSEKAHDFTAAKFDELCEAFDEARSTKREEKV